MKITKLQEVIESAKQQGVVKHTVYTGESDYMKLVEEFGIDSLNEMKVVYDPDLKKELGEAILSVDKDIFPIPNPCNKDEMINIHITSVSII